MPCAVTLKKFNNLLVCQFELPEEELISFSNRQWCCFHLPVKDEVGNKSQKALWSENENEDFNSSIENLIKENNHVNKAHNFRHVIFPSFFSTSIQFQNDAFFSYCEFKAGAKFKGRFYKDALFDNTKFEHSVFFNGLTFVKNVSFKNAEFIVEADFHNAIFYKKISFKYAIFYGDVMFENTAFLSEAIFTHAKFHQSVNFFTNDQKIDFRDDKPCFKNLVSFAETRFYGKATFTNRVFYGKTIFTDCVFHVAPEFHGCKLHQDTNFPSEKGFLDTGSPEAAKAYRTLCLSMADFKARQEEAMFYALEQKSLRPTMKRVDKFLSCLYWITTNYGQSTGKAIISFIILNCLFLGLYATLMSPTINFHPYDIDLHILFDATKFTFQQIVKPFNVLTDFNLIHKIHVTYIKKGIFFLLATIQSIASLGVVALILLTIRWRFKRE